MPAKAGVLKRGARVRALWRERSAGRVGGSEMMRGVTAPQHDFAAWSGVGFHAATQCKKSRFMQVLGSLFFLVVNVF